MTSAVTAGTTVAAPTTCRVLLVQNKQPNTASTNGEDVMGLNGAAAANALVAVHMFQGVQSFGRFKIVDDILINLDVGAAANNASATTVSSVCQEKSLTLSYRPKKPIIIEYAGTATAVPNTNSFTVLANADATTYAPTLQGVLRFYYTDV